jgi:hypothetical protein
MRPSRTATADSSPLFDWKKGITYCWQLQAALYYSRKKIICILNINHGVYISSHILILDSLSYSNKDELKKTVIKK